MRLKRNYNMKPIFEYWRQFIKESKSGNIIAIFGPSGSGKSRQKNIFKNNGWKELISLVTRAPRSEDDVEYEFTTEEEWLEKDKSGELINTNEYGGNFYGTKLQDFLNAEKAILVTDETSIDGSKGEKDLKKIASKYGKDLILVFSAPPSEEELKRRHLDRLDRGEYNSQEEYEARLSKAMEEARDMQEKILGLEERVHVVYDDHDVEKLIKKL
jgi:guanylate kinase